MEVAAQGDPRVERTRIAVQMVALGFGAFPLRTLDKRPFTKNGFKDAVFTEKQVQTFLGHAGVTGYGLVAPEGSDLIVWDIDPGDGKGQSWRQAFDDLTAKIGSKLPPTLAVRTPSGGWHLYFRVPKELAEVRSDLMLDFTVRRPWMGYVVGPGSEVKREDGTVATYQVIHDGPIAQLPPEWVNAAMAWSPKAAAAGLIVISGGYQMPAVVHENHRYDAIRGYVAHLYNTGLSVEEIWALVVAQLAPRFSPQLSEPELRDRFDRVTKDMAARLGPPAITTRKATQTVEQRQQIALTRGSYALRPFASYAERELDWLWPDWVPRGVVTLLDGNPGVGKSNIVIDLVARGTTMSPWPDGQRGLDRPMKTIYITREDDPSTTLGPRLRAAGGDPNYAFFLPEEFVLPDDALRLDALIAAEEPDLVFIDPIFSHISADVKTISDNDARVNVMNPLMQIAERHNVAILAARHFNKSVGSSALNRGAGSLGGFVGAARQVLAVVHDPEDDERLVRIVGVVKSSYATEKNAMKYWLEPVLLPGRQRTLPKVTWLGRSMLSIDDILSDTNPIASRGAAEELETILQGVPSMATKEVLARMKAAGYGKAASYTAAKRIGVKQQRQGFPSSSVWSLAPASHAPAHAGGASASGTTGMTGTTGGSRNVLQSSQSSQSSQLSHGHEGPGMTGETSVELEPPEVCQDPKHHRDNWCPSLVVVGEQYCPHCVDVHRAEREAKLLDEAYPDA